VPLAFRCLRLVAAPLAMCLTLAPPSLALTFSSSCDRFEIDGNTFGPADGTLDFVDEFDSGMLAPNWTVLLGSAQETGSDVIVHSPRPAWSHALRSATPRRRARRRGTARSAATPSASQ